MGARLGPGAWTAGWIAALVAAAALGLSGRGQAGLWLALAASLALAVRLLGEVHELRAGVHALQRKSGVPEGGRPTEVIERVVERLSDAVSEAEAERDDLLAVLESAGEGILVLGPHLRIEQVNDVARRLLGLPVDAPGRVLAELCVTRELLEFAEALLRGEQPRATRVELGSDEDVLSVLLSGNLITSGVLRRRAVLVLHDLTDLRHLERVRTDFVANVTHEMRSPLTSILGYAETLQDLIDPADELAQDCLRRVIRNAQRLEGIIRDLTELSRLEHATGAELAATDVAALGEAVLAELSDAAAEKDVALERDFDLPRRLSVDPGLLRQALSNLVDNAVKYTPAGGRIRLAGRVEGDLLCLAVHDDGPGIPLEHQTRIFERFYRVDTARSRQVGGTGLGLSIVKHAAALHGGTVRLRSRPGVETTFELRIPVPELAE